MEDIKKALKEVPSLLLTLFVIAIVTMNLLANKSINLSVDWLALDCGIIVSWLSFMTMDIIVKKFGAKTSIIVSIVALLVSLLVSVLLFVGASIPGAWSESFVENGDIINNALNATFAGSWYVVFGSSIAFLTSSVVNNVLNEWIGNQIQKKNFTEFALRSYISTGIGQFVDNLVFALIVSLNFFGWNLLQCFTCALTGAIVELLFEVIFSPFGYLIVKNWND
ncbi:MAG: VUT family protein [Firmicutes bacterium]|nr:VUT family protein [Bacillota bacterium]